MMSAAAIYWSRYPCDGASDVLLAPRPGNHPATRSASCLLLFAGFPLPPCPHLAPCHTRISFDLLGKGTVSNPFDELQHEALASESGQRHSSLTGLRERTRTS